MEGSTLFTDVLLVYAVTQLLSTAYGLTVIGALRPIIEDKLKNKGYIEREKNSLYKFNDKLNAILLGLVPFYYGYKGLKLVQGKIDRAVDEEIISGDWITQDEQRKIFEKTELEKQDESLFVPQARVEFEKTEVYKARRTDNSLYNIYETPEEFASREMSEEESLQITPFTLTGDIKANDKKEVSYKEVASFISELREDQLADLNALIERVIENERSKNYQRVLEKDIA